MSEENRVTIEELGRGLAAWNAKHKRYDAPETKLLEFGEIDATAAMIERLEARRIEKALQK